MKISGVLIVSIVLFYLIFSILPEEKNYSSSNKIQLSNIKMKLYPQNSNSDWEFKAKIYEDEPISNSKNLKGEIDGRRIVYKNGKEFTDAYLISKDLKINSQGSMLTGQAKIILIKECASIVLFGTKNRKVEILPDEGFYAPIAEISSPLMNGRMLELKMTFDFLILSSSTESKVNLYDEKRFECKHRTL